MRLKSGTSSWPPRHARAANAGEHAAEPQTVVHHEKGDEMKLVVAVVLALAVVCGPTLADDLKKLNLDDASTIGLRIETDLSVKVEGRGSVRITTQWPTTVCLGEVAGLDIDNARLMYTAKVKSDLDGVAFLEMWAHVGGGQFFSRGMDSTVTGKAGWKSIQTPFLLQKGQKLNKITLNLVINGKGTVWIDDVVLSKEPLK
jgi:hypothetical protein